MTDNDLRGSAPILTAKDVLLEVRDEVKHMRSAVDVLVSQNLDLRVDSLESTRDQARGLARLAIVLASVATVVSAVVGVISLLRP